MARTRTYAVLAGALAGAALAQRQHLRRVASDPLSVRLASPPRGRVLEAQSADGTGLHIEVFGEDTSPPIVLAHGWTEQLIYWTLVVEELVKHGYRAIAYDLRGHGRSEPASGADYGLSRFGEDVEAVLGATCGPGEAPVVAGHSLGGMSIMAWAEHHRVEDRAGAAALLNTGAGDLIADALIVPVPWIANALNRTPLAGRLLSAPGRTPGFSTPISAAAIRYAAFGPSATPALVAFYERMLVETPPDVRATVGLSLSTMELHHALPRLTVPTLVMAGEDDRLTPPSHAERIAAEVPALEQLIVLPGTGHMGPLERPSEVADALITLARTARATAAGAAA
jgi:pimeloyl-ACP methyl ester carboxylesterase